MRRQIDWEGVGNCVLRENYLIWSDERIAGILGCSREAVRNQRHSLSLHKGKGRGKHCCGIFDPDGRYQSWATDSPRRHLFNFKQAMDDLVTDIQVEFARETGILLSDKAVRTILSIPRYGIPIFRVEAWRFGVLPYHLDADGVCGIASFLPTSYQGE